MPPAGGNAAPGMALVVLEKGGADGKAAPLGSAESAGSIAREAKSIENEMSFMPCSLITGCLPLVTFEVAQTRPDLGPQFF